MPRVSRPETVVKALLKLLNARPDDVEEVEIGPDGRARLKLRARAVGSPVHVPAPGPRQPELRRAVDFLKMPPRHFAPES